MPRSTYPTLHFRIKPELEQALEEAAKKSGMASWSKNDQARYMLEQLLGVWREPWMPTSSDSSPIHVAHRRRKAV